MDDTQISKGMRIVTPSDTDPANGIGFVFTGGTCAVETASGDVLTVPAAFANVIFPQAIKRVLTTGTTATTVIVFRG